jgi:hypothetical protein
MNSTSHVRTAIVEASGASSACAAFTVNRWDARHPGSPEHNEVALFALDRGELSLLYRSATIFHGVWRTDAGHVHLALPRSVERFAPREGSWQRDTFAIQGIYTRLSGVDGGLAFALGLDDALLWDGATWSPVAAPGPLTAVHGASRALVMAVGHRGLVARWEGTAWRALEAPGDEDLVAVHAASEDDVWVLGAGGTIYHGSSERLRAVFRGEKKLRAVARFAGSTWVAVDGEGLFRYAEGALALVKDTFKPTRLEARRELVCSAPEAVVTTADGQKFLGTQRKTISPLLEAIEPLWT